MNNCSFLFLKLFFSYLDVVAVCSALDQASNLWHFTMTKGSSENQKINLK